MKTKQKLAIFAAAVLLSFFGFSLMASPSVELIKMGKDAGTQSLASLSGQGRRDGPRQPQRLTAFERRDVRPRLKGRRNFLVRGGSAAFFIVRPPGPAGRPPSRRSLRPRR